jgi:hypothetical protein
MCFGNSPDIGSPQIVHTWSGQIARGNLSRENIAKFFQGSFTMGEMA